MEFGDIELVCRDCNNQFLFTAGEQAYYQRMGLQNTPGRCPDCRARRKQRAAQEGPASIVCSPSGQQQELINHAVSPQPVSQPPSIVPPPVEQPVNLETSAITKAQSATDNALASATTLQTATSAIEPASKLLLKKRWKAKSRVLVFFSVQIYAVKDEGESDNVVVAVVASESDNAAIAADKEVAANSNEAASENAQVIEPAMSLVATTTPTTATTTTVVTAIICSSCGRRTTVPFVPEPGRPVYCASCFFKQ